MKLWKRLLFFVLASMMAVCVLSGCGGSSSPAASVPSAPSTDPSVSGKPDPSDIVGSYYGPNGEEIYIDYFNGSFGFYYDNPKDWNNSGKGGFTMDDYIGNGVFAPEDDATITFSNNWNTITYRGITFTKAAA